MHLHESIAPRVSSLFASGLLVAAALSLLACELEPQPTHDDDTAETAAADRASRAESSPSPINATSRLGVAKQLADRALDIVRERATAHPDAVFAALAPPMRKLEDMNLTPAELDELQRHVDVTGADVRAIVEGWGAQDPAYAFSSPTDGDGCHVYCLLFFLISCDSGNLVGGCFGAWDCTAGTVVECDDGGDPIPEDPSECRRDSDCPAGYRCATWVFKDNECLFECEDDSDCPGDQQCKKPFGTHFKRCK